MADPEITKQVGKMREDWERRARENARYYVATHRKDWSDEEFFRSGELVLQEEILSDMGNICQGRNPQDMKVLEIGCGAGRVTRALAGLFGHVYAVDISGEMVRQAKLALQGFPHARVFRNNGRDLSVVRRRWWHRWGMGGKLQLDFAFSCIVFQHIPSREIIENYVREVHRLLRPGALFKFQVQGGRVEAPEEADTWTGVSFTEQEARDMARRCGFEMRYQYGLGDQYYWLWFFKE